MMETSHEDGGPPTTIDTNIYCAYCQLALDSFDTRVCSACGNIFCDLECFNDHNVTGYHYGDDWYNDGRRRKLLSPHDYSYMQVPWSNNQWVPALEYEDDEEIS